MSDTFDNDTEEETSGFGLGRGLDALFGDDEVMGLDDDEPAAAAEKSAEAEAEADLPAEEEGLDMAALMGEVEPSEQEEDEAIAAPQQIEEPQSETEVIIESVSETEVEVEVDVEIDMAAAMAEAPQEEAAITAEEQIAEAAVTSESEEDLIEEIETLIETIEEEDNVLDEAQQEEIMDMAAAMTQEAAAEPKTSHAPSDAEIDMAAAMAEEPQAPQETAEETEEKRKTLTDAADSLVSALERHIEETESAPKSGRARQSIPIENLYPSPFQPRKIFRQESIDELSSSIRQYGVLQPLLVRKDPKNDDGYEIIAGERRWRASQQAQIHELPVVILEIDELEAYKIALIENLQREDIDPIDEAFGYQKLLEDFGQTQEQLADAVGKSRPHITNTLRLLQLSETTQAMLSDKQLSMGHARALIGVDNADEIAKKVVKQGLSVRQTEKLAANAKGKEQTKRPRGASPANTSKPAKDADTIALENDISNALGMNVNIDSVDGKSGKLSVEFKSLDQLDELLHRLAHFPGTRLSG